jgi:hypothetical protein
LSVYGNQVVVGKFFSIVKHAGKLRQTTKARYAEEARSSPDNPY